MYKVMLIEDEPPILRNLEKKVNGLLGKFEVCYTATIAEDAIANIPKFMPHVIISDMKLIGKSGIWVFKKVREEYPGIICIALSGYKDFEFVRECLRLQVEDYLTKPISMEELNSKFSKIAQKLEFIEKENNCKEIRYLLRNDITLGNSPLFKKYKSFRMINVHFGSLLIQKNINLIIRSDDILKNFATLKKYLISNIKQDYWGFEQNETNSFLIFICETEKENIDNFYLEIATKIEELFHGLISTTIVISSSIGKNSSIYSIRKKIQRKLSESAIIGHSRIILLNNNAISDNMVDIFSMEQIKSKFVSKYLRGDAEGFTKEIRKLFEIFKEEEKPQLIVQSTLEMIVQTCELMMDRKPEWTNLFTFIRDDISEIFFEASDMNELSNDICKYLNIKLFNNALNEYETKDFIAEKIEKYLNDNYMHQISLSSLADIFGYTPQYLSRYFKMKRGESPIKYLINIRIKKAREIIKSNPEIMFTEVADMVGYDDSHYFSKLFKQFTGETLTEYKERYTNKL